MQDSISRRWMMPIKWSIEAQREASKNDGKASCKEFGEAHPFQAVIFGARFVPVFHQSCGTTIGSALGYRLEWVRHFLGEAESLVFVLYNFWPNEKNPYNLFAGLSNPKTYLVVAAKMWKLREAMEQKSRWRSHFFS